MSSGLQFCPECNNLLYPKEDRAREQLVYVCRSCEWVQYADPEDPEDNCAERINYNFRSKEDITSYIVRGLGDDPTLPREVSWVCPECDSVGAVYFQLPERVKSDAMTLVFVCIKCTHYIVKGKESKGEKEEIDDAEEEALQRLQPPLKMPSEITKAVNVQAGAGGGQIALELLTNFSGSVQGLTRREAVEDEEEDEDNDEMTNAPFGKDETEDEGPPGEEEEEEEEDDLFGQDENDENEQQRLGGLEEEPEEYEPGATQPLH